MKPSKLLFAESFQLFKAHWGKCIGIALFFGICSGLVQNVLVAQIAKGAEIAFVTGQTAYIVLGFVLLLLGMVAILFSVILNSAGRVSIIHTVDVFNSGEDRPFWQLVSESFRKALSYMWVVFLTMFAVTTGFVFFVVPGMFLAVALMFATYANVVDGKKGLDALAYSKQLLKGRFWQIVGKTLYPAVWMLTYMLALAVLGGLVFLLYKFAGPMWAMILGLIIGLAALVGFVILTGASIVYAYKVYREVQATDTAAADMDAMSKERKKLKTLAWIGVVLLMAITMTVGYLSVTNPTFRAYLMNDTHKGENMGATYKDYGIEFERPATWEFVGPTDRDGAIEGLSYFGPQDAAGDDREERGYIEILGFDGAPGTASNGTPHIADVFIKTLEDGKKAGEVKSFSTEEKDFGTFKATVITTVEDMNGEPVVGIVALIKSVDSVYIFDGLADPEYKEDLKNALDMMLRSVKFYDDQKSGESNM